MTTLLDAVRNIKLPRFTFVAALMTLLLVGFIAMVNLGRSHRAAELNKSMPRGALENGVAGRAYSPALMTPKLSAFVQTAGIADSQIIVPNAGPDAGAGRRIVRNASIEMVVQHPAEVADRITAIAEKLGGYLVSVDGVGQNATTATVTVRMPLAHFEDAREEFRELGVRIENEKFEAQDVTEQYIDQDASIRNLQAEEFQYLEILKRANDINSMMLVAGKLSQVRGEIEKKQAEFNSLSHQTETVAIAISLRTEREQQFFRLNWRLGDELKQALRDGLESLANYTTAMMTILFYLPALVLWVVTILATVVTGKRVVLWVGRRWFGWKAGEAAVLG